MRQVLWRVINTVQWAAIVLWSVGWISVALLIVTLTRSRRIPLFLARWCWCPGILATIGVRLKVRAPTLPSGRGCFVVSNHQSFVDIPTLIRALPMPISFVAKRELGAVPFLGWYIRRMGMVLVDRRARGKSASGTAQIGELLSSGHSVITFPAGTRSRDGSVQRFKGGGFAAAIDSQAPIVPVAIWGAHRALPPQSWKGRPALVRVAIGDPIPTTGLDRSHRHELAERVRAEIARMQEELRREEAT